MDILFVVITPGGDVPENRIALVPSTALSNLTSTDLDNMNGVILNLTPDWEFTKETGDLIEDLYYRFGLEGQGPEEEAKADLKAYLDPKPPFSVDRVITIGWAV